MLLHLKEPFYWQFQSSKGRHYEVRSIRHLFSSCRLRLLGPGADKNSSRLKILNKYKAFFTWREYIL